LVVIGVGELDDDIDVQAANTDIAASDAATIGPAVRVLGTDAMVGFLVEGADLLQKLDSADVGL
jgi:hypothetical protein